MTRHDNGDVSFPIKGNPPPEIPNYTRDPSDPYLFHPNFPPCRYRLNVVKRGPCGKITGRLWTCKLKGGVVSVPICQNCKEIEE